MITVPRPFAELVARREGATGAAWLADLPALVDDLLDRFGCRPDGPPGFGGVGLVVPVRRDDVPAVLKVSMPHPGNVGEAAALRLLGGRGAVRLLDDDPERYALLLERVGPVALTILEDRPDAVIEILREATGSSAGATVLMLMLSWNGLVALFSSLASVSRLTWAFAKDRGLPFPEFLACPLRRLQSRRIPEDAR